MSWKNYNIDKIHSSTSGKGNPPIVFLHGWGSNPDVFKGLLPSLGQHRKIFNVALPGFGMSPDIDEAWDTWNFVEAINIWLERNKLDSVDLIGHSHGGRIGIGLASGHPERINRLVLISSAGLIMPKSLETKLKIFTAKSLNWIGNSLGGKVKSFTDARREKLGSADWKAASKVMRQTLSRVVNQDLSNELGSIQAPTILIWGENDDAVPVEIGMKMAKLIPDSELVIIKNAGHYCFLDKQGETLAAIWKGLGLPSVW